MLSLPSSVRVYAALGAVDMRRSFDGLAAATRTVLQQDPMSGALFLFFNRRLDLVKCLWWDRGGWCLFAKRLGKGTFKRPPTPDAATSAVEIDGTALAMILDGIDLRSTRKRQRFEPGVLSQNTHFPT
jgi:transposase